MYSASLDDLLKRSLDLPHRPQSTRTEHRVPLRLQHLIGLWPVYYIHLPCCQHENRVAAVCGRVGDLVAAMPEYRRRSIRSAPARTPSSPQMPSRWRCGSASAGGPIIFTVGAALVPRRGKPGYLRDRYFPEIGRPEDARDLVRQQSQAGVGGIKLFAGSPTSKGVVLMPAAVARAVTDAAHERKLPVFAHPTTTRGVEVALAAGVDILAHVSPEDMRPWSDDLIAQLRARDVALIPTLKMYRWDPRRQGVSNGYIERLTRTSAAQLGRYSAAGGTILFGADVGYMTDYDPTEEFELMSRAGMAFQQILASLTTAPAERFGLSPVPVGSRPAWMQTWCWWKEIRASRSRRSPPRSTRCCGERRCTTRESCSDLSPLPPPRRWTRWAPYGSSHDPPVVCIHAGGARSIRVAPDGREFLLPFPFYLLATKNARSIAPHSCAMTPASHSSR
jgi:hypothetical protein